MYIRRKVFSSVYDEETGEERLFSTTEFMNEETYLEQRIYAEAEEDEEAPKKGNKAAKIAGISAGATAAAAGGGIYGAKKIGERIEKNAMKDFVRPKKVVEALGTKAEKEAYAKAEKLQKLGQKLQKPGKAIEKAAKSVSKPKVYVRAAKIAKKAAKK